MLYEDFDAKKRTDGEDVFTSRLDGEVVQNLNPKFELREYQKEAIGRFDFYFGGYQQRKFPAQLLFHMATGSGKTLIMAANILQLYKQGYRNFIFFVNSTNIIEKTKDNFLNSLSEKYLFAPKIKFGDKEVFVKEVNNFEAASTEDINILFATTSLLHIRINNPKENALTEEEFEGKDIVLISDEAHHVQAITRNKKEEELEKTWEYTVLKKIFGKSPKNILLEFTATIDLSNEDIRKKYEDKIIYQYDLKRFRLDKYSKEIEVLEADLEPVERALQAVVLSQYRRKIAEKHKLRLKPVLLFKSKTIKESGENYSAFLEKIKSLSVRDLENIAARAKGTSLEKVFAYLAKAGIGLENLIKELREDFAEERCMLLDSENIDEEKQLKLNSLEDKNNEIRAIFAVNMLNEGWDVLNLFDIVRLYDTRDGKYVGGKYKPGNTTMGEAQLIGRGARYFPFQTNETEDKYKRKFDKDAENELRIIETLHYHSAHNPKYIEEIKSTLTELGIIPEKHVQVSLFIKPEFKKSKFWKRGVVFINDRAKNQRKEIFSLANARIETNYKWRLKTGELTEIAILDESEAGGKNKTNGTVRKTFKFSDFGENVLRGALDKIEFFKFYNLKRYFPHIKSVREFITSPEYLGGIDIEISGPKGKVNGLTAQEKIEAVLFVIKTISEQAKTKTSDFVGTNLFKAKMLKEVFYDKKIKIDKDEVENKKLEDVNLTDRDWYAQTEFYGTDEEQNFISFIDGFIEKLRQKYSDIALLRNEKFFQVFGFDDGGVFEPDFIMLLKRRNHVVNIYQIFIEPKGNQFKDRKGRFEDSKEGWKQKFLLELETKADTDFKLENTKFKLIGLPFYNEQLKREFEEALESKTLG